MNRDVGKTEQETDKYNAMYDARFFQIMIVRGLSSPLVKVKLW